MTNYFLNLLINVFGVKPTFLLPIFSDGHMFFFQEIEYDKISSFSEADLTCFAECEQIKVESNIEYTVDSSAVYALQLPSGNYTIGHSKEILDYLDDHASLLDQYPIFRENVQGFQERIRHANQVSFISKKPKKSWLEIMSAFSKLAPLKYKASLKCQASSKHNMASSKKYNVIYSLVSKRFPEGTGDADTNKHKYEISLLGPQTENIFQFREYIESEGESKLNKGKSKFNNRNFSLIRFEQKNDCPVSAQIKVIDILLKYSPSSYVRMKKNRSISLEGYAYAPNFNENLWTYSHVYKLFDLPDYYQFLWTDDRLRSVVREWGLYIKSPTENILNGVPLSELLIWLNELSQSEENIDVNSDEIRIFWLEIRKMSDHINAIIAQDFYSKCVHFWIKKEPISDTILSSFIDGLYRDVESKVLLLLVNIECDGNPINDCFAEWLNQNEEKCQLIEIPKQLNAR